MSRALLARRCARIEDSRAFDVVIVVTIGANAALLCAETYPRLAHDVPALVLINNKAEGSAPLTVRELAIRAAKELARNER